MSALFLELVRTILFLSSSPTCSDWVNPSNRGGMDGVAGLQGCSKEQPCRPEENRSHLTLLLGFTFKIGHFGDISDLFLQILTFEEQ